MHNTPHTDEAKAKMSAARKGVPATWKHRESKIVDGVIQYRCGRCCNFFPKDGFYANRKTLLGIKSECKSCHSITSIRSRDPDNARRLRRESVARQRIANPELARARDRAASAKRMPSTKTKAREALNAAVKSGSIVRPNNCDVCLRSARVHGHHDDYSKPLSVRWVCPLCHANIHRGITP